MTPYQPYKTASLLAPFNDVHHLFAVMNDPCPEKMCLIIMVTSIKPGRAYDPACVLDVGDHPFIQHPSYLLYRLAQTPPSPHLGKMVDKKFYLTREDMGGKVFARIAEGIYESDDTPSRVMKYAKANGI